MKFLLLTILLGYSFSASAQFLEPSSLKIIGRGLQKKGSTESIALACENQECNQLRFVHFSETGDASFIGDPMVMQEYHSERLEDKALELKIREYMYVHSTEQSEEKRNKIKAGVYIFATAGLFTAAMLNPGTAAVYAVMGGYVVIAMVMSNTRLDAAFSGDMGNQISFSDQDGWNWSQKAVQVRKKDFDVIHANIVNTVTRNIYYPLTSEGVAIERKQNRLERKNQNI
jgi:hypothetical protein